MQFFSSDTPLTWGELDLPLLGIDSDWFGAKLIPALGFSLASDGINLWFLASRQVPASIHPQAIPGKFTPNLWKHDVAELFLANPQTGEYLEFNLAANGSWWASKFSAARIPSARQPDFESYVITHYDNSYPSAWLAALVVPISFLEQQIAFSPATTANATFIQSSPNQIFLTAVSLPGQQPNFHQATYFSTLDPTKIPII